jgi:enterochelin esterase-like enzyme
MKKFFLTIFLMTPIIAVASVLYIFAIGVNNPNKQIAHVPAVGAGAGKTGGANAIGEMLYGRTATGETREAKAAGAVEGTSAKASDAQAEPNMVKPESLPQGFIIVVEDKAKLATQASPIYLAGSFNGWVAGDLKHRLTPQSDMKWRIEMPQHTGGGEFNFKFTRGSWELEELQDDMTPPTNRKLPLIDASKLAPGEKPILEFSVSKWGDQRENFKQREAANPYNPMQITGTHRRVQVSGAPSFVPPNPGEAPGAAAGSIATPAGAQRELIVWLPANYDQAVAAGKKFPVLFLHDGQNLFAEHPGIKSEWGVDEAATALIASGKVEPLIIVGIPHAGPGRIREYLPARIGGALEKAEPAGDEYVAWLAEEIVPKIRSLFAVETDPSRVAIGGSSLGAVIALHAVDKHPELFGVALLESPALRAGSPESWQSWLSGIQHWPKKAFVGVGTKELENQADGSPENKAYVDASTDLEQRLKKSGAATKLVVDAGAVHNEGAWKKRFPGALEYLFPAKK